MDLPHTVDVNDETALMLAELVRKTDKSMAEVIFRAVAVYKFVETELADDHKELQLVNRKARSVTRLQLT